VSVGSHPAIPPRKAARSLTSRLHPLTHLLRAATAKSVLVRVLLISVVAMLVTTGGVMAGALVVAPVVAHADSHGAGTALSSQFASAVSFAGAAARGAWGRIDHMTADLLAALPEPVARYLLPSIAILSILGAGLALLLPSRSPRSAPTWAFPGSMGGGPRLARATPTGSAKLASRKQRTPKAVEALAASGVSTADIAWKTGLPIDAVRLLLAISSGPRQVHPDTA